VVPCSDGEKRQCFELYNGKGWTFHNAADMKAVIAQEFKSFALPPYRASWVTDKHLVPKPLNSVTFASGLVEHVLAIAAKHSRDAASLDGSHSRHRLLFADGMLYDFEASLARHVQPADRMGFHVPFNYVEWEPTDPAQARAIFVSVREVYLSGKGLDDAEEGVRIKEALTELAKECEILRVIFASQDSWDVVLYILRCFTRAVVADARFCEFLYVFGCASGGKDVLLLIFLSFFGSGRNNYGYVLSGSFLTQHSKGKEGASPFLAESQGKRFVWCSEVPEHTDLDLGLLKAFCEQSTPITARRLYRAPTLFEPMGWLVASSNYPPVVRQREDDGFIRRNRVLTTKKKFSAKPADLRTAQADPKLKPRIKAGEFNGQLLYLAKMLLPTIDTEVCGGTNIEPIPDSVKEFLDLAEKEAVEAAAASMDPLVWLKERTEPVMPRTEGSPADDIRKALTHLTGKSEAAMIPMMTRMGLKSAVNGAGVRVLTYAHPDWVQSGPLPALRIKKVEKKVETKV
jgi:hypothetical protein